MAVATPILERKLNTAEEIEEVREADVMTAEERHNSKISANYAKLINPEYTVNDIIVRQPAETPKKQQLFMPVKEEYVEKPYLVENARADAAIFRADSVINRKVEKAEIVSCEDEDNEDLRPTQTTIQYKTAGVKKTNEQGKIENAGSVKRKLAKKDKIIIAAVISVVIALFVLIIINSAIISHVGNDLSALETALDTAKITYAQSSGEMQQYLSELPQIVTDFATQNGMVLR